MRRVGHKPDKKIKKEGVKMKKETKSWMEKFYDGLNYQLLGIGCNYSQYIDKDQVVDDAGKAVYKHYALIDLRTGEIEFISAKEMEEFAETW
jgi:hypothetical protein